jgi:hypothetical protein
MPEPTARARIENLWDRAFVVGPLLDAYHDEVLTEAAELIRARETALEAAELAKHGRLDHQTYLARDAMNLAADWLLAARTGQEN